MRPDSINVVAEDKGGRRDWVGFGGVSTVTEIIEERINDATVRKQRMVQRVPCLTPAEKQPERRQTPARISLVNYGTFFAILCHSGQIMALHDMTGMNEANLPT
jgi:hypothetical protein